MAVTGLVLLPIVRISLTVQGSGIIRPVLEKTEIKSTKSELVSKVFVQEGQQVIALYMLYLPLPGFDQFFSTGFRVFHF